MTIAYLGGFEITGVEWRGLTAIAVDVVTDYTDRHLQLYAGRRLIGSTRSAGQTTVVGQLLPSHCPPPLTIVMCGEAERLTDFGSKLPPRPFNQFDLSWLASSFPADAKWFEIAAAIVADGEVDPENVLARVQYIGDGAYRFLLPPVTAPGMWPYRITPRDDAEPEGNAGAPAEIAKYALPYPPDTAIDEDGNRLTVEQDGDELTVSFAFNW